MKFFKVIYNGWMKVVKVIGRVQTVILLTLIYFIGVGLIGIIFFILRRDMLGKKLKKGLSFWRGRQSLKSDLESSKRLF